VDARCVVWRNSTTWCLPAPTRPTLLTRLFAIGLDLRALARCNWRAIGPGTADALAAYHLRADVVPEQEYRAEGLLNVLPTGLGPAVSAGPR